MSAVLYPSAKSAFLKAEIDLLDDTINAALVGSAYSYNSSHEYWSSVVGNLVGAAVTLSGKAVSAGAFDATNALFSAVTGLQVGAVVLYKYTGNNATSPLIAYDNTLDGLPFTPDGRDVTIAWNNGTYKIFGLSDV